MVTVPVATNILRPTKILWIYPELSPNDVWYAHIQSKSMRKLASHLNEQLKSYGIELQILPLTNELYIKWYEFYTASMLELGHDVIASVDWYSKRETNNTSFWILQYKKGGDIVGGSIVSLTSEGLCTHHFKASSRIKLPATETVSLGMQMEMAYLQFAHSLGANKITSGLSRNGFGFYNSLGYLASKLRMGYLPTSSEKHPVDNTFYANDNEAPTAYFIITSDKQTRFLLYPNKTNFATELIQNFDRSNIGVVSYDQIKLLQSSDVYNYYWNTISDLSPYNKFHFLSRLFLVAGDLQASKELNSLHNQWTLGKTKENYYQVLQQHVVNPKQPKSLERQMYLDHYQFLREFAADAFIVLFAQRIWNDDVSELALHKWSAEKLGQTAARLLNDESALLSLRTYALNYLYLYAHFYSTELAATLITDLYNFITKQWDSQLGMAEGLEALAYFVTHQIINDSLFYTRPIPADHKDLHLQFISKIYSELLDKPLSTLSVDCLCEIEVCYQLLGVESPRHNEVFEYVSAQTSQNGSYLIEPGHEASLSDAEHRNVLYLLAFKDMKRIEPSTKL